MNYLNLWPKPPHSCRGTKDAAPQAEACGLLQTGWKQVEATETSAAPVVGSTSTFSTSLALGNCSNQSFAHSWGTVHISNFSCRRILRKKRKPTERYWEILWRTETARTNSLKNKKWHSSIRLGCNLFPLQLFQAIWLISVLLDSWASSFL